MDLTIPNGIALSQAMVSGLASYAFTARLGWIDIKKKEIRVISV